MGLFDDIGSAISNVANDVGRTVSNAASDVGRAVEDVARDVANAVTGASGGATIGGVIGTILLGPVGGAIGAVAGNAIAPTPLGEMVEDVVEGVGDAGSNVLAGNDMSDEMAEIIAGIRGLEESNRPKRRGELEIRRGDDDPNARTPLVAGEETPVTVNVASLRGNSNVRRISATLLVADATRVPQPEATVATVDSTANETTDTVAVTIATPRRPRNVRIRLDGGVPFWTHPTPLDEPQYPLPDFADAVNAYLDKAVFAGDGVPLRFLVHSDTPGMVGIRIDPASVDATAIHMQSWTNAVDHTMHLDRTLTIDYATVAEVPLTMVDAPATGRIALLQIMAEVDGTVGAERLVGDVTTGTSSEAATVSVEYAVAQRTTPGVALQCVGISAFLLNDAPARLYAELQSEANGAPAIGAPLARAELTLPAPSPGTGAGSWVYIAFERPGAIDATQSCWMVLRGVEGEARVALERSGAGATFGTGAVMSRGGQRWLPVAPGRAPAAMLRLVHLPGPETTSAPIELEVRRTAANGNGGATTLVRQRVDPRGAQRSVSLPLGDGVERAPLTLVVRSYARGTVRLANVTQEYAIT
jgi:hypothetical protein